MKNCLLSVLLIILFTNTLCAQKIESFPVHVNSDYHESRPMVSAQGDKLYFSRRNHPENVGGKRDESDIWVASLKKGHPTSHPLPGLNTKKADALVSICADEQEMMVFNTGRFHQAPLLHYKRKGDEWEKQGECIIDDFYNLSDFADFYYSFSDSVMFLAVKRNESFGGQDLYISFRKANRHWSAPQHLTSISSGEDDFAPFLAADGETLFFCSYGFGGKGGADIFYAKRLDDTWLNWTAPITLNGPVNSRNEEIYVSVSPDLKHLYFDSFTPKSSNRNIYRYALPNGEIWSHGNSPSLAENPKETLPTPSYSPFAKPESLTSTTKIKRNIYFQANTAQVKGDMQPIVKETLDLLMAYPQTMLEIVGHTDNTGGERVNTALALSRAEKVKEAFENLHIPSHRIRIVSMGSQQPLASNDDEAGGRELNRRVEIYLVPTKARPRFEYTMR